MKYLIHSIASSLMLCLSIAVLVSSNGAALFGAIGIFASFVVAVLGMPE